MDFSRKDVKFMKAALKQAQKAKSEKGGEIDAVVALDGYAKDGLVVLLVDFAVAGEGKRRVAD